MTPQLFEVNLVEIDSGRIWSKEGSSLRTQTYQRVLDRDVF